MSLRKSITSMPTEGDETVPPRSVRLRVDIPDTDPPEPASADSPQISAAPVTALSHAGDRADLIQLLVDFFGHEFWESLRGHAAFQGHYIDNASDVRQWLEHVVDTFLPLDRQLQMLVALRDNYVGPRAELLALQQELSALRSTSLAEAASSRVACERLQAEAVRIRRRLDASVGADQLIRTGLQAAPAALRHALLEAAGDQEAGFGLFVLALALHWPQFISSIAADGDDEARVRQLDAATRPFWSAISGLGFARRQALLGMLAASLSDLLSGFEMVSPEDYRVVDPAVHDVRNAAGQRVREGGSFIIFRRQPRVVYQQGLVTSE